LFAYGFQEKSVVTVFENFKENIDWRLEWNLSELYWLREFCVTTVFGNAKLNHPYAHTCA